ncbi:MAG: L,D-transpeptidase/peptidoglycan binding protein [Actinobacteria bacterium]|nr:L,D-transpeptidase/peptidoglycan binding protein [Actinomycetota bacterium]MBU4219270.1 L,D-transpeptidase/peptidoglycan binding protein [Actinomycetota bacterium]MBU4359554.1 L,D-transpeptidase/peptidoglycan binding protein [Actinomycetota bacterium]MBU4390844.1 L,D-transpeptidase/peptidoglycan binding protein [Actinomycetota bacterium]MCG2819766.1 L,D-transpeptidase/peptidoglycan binding protein [Actinomycetes bacterium]
MESRDMKQEKPIVRRGPVSRRLRRAYLYLRRANPLRVVLAVAASFLAVVIVGLLSFLFVQDIALSGRIFPGITIDGHAVGGLSGSDALEVVQKGINVPVDQSVVLYLDGGEFAIDPGSIDFKVDTEKMVDSAFRAGSSEIILSRMFRRFLNKPLNVDIPVMVSFDEEKLKQAVTGVATDVNYPPKSAGIDMSSGQPEISDDRPGLSVNQEATMKAIAEALPTPNRRIALVTESIKPEMTVADIGYIVVVHLSQHTLYLYDKEHLDSSYMVCIGSEKYPTPTGKFHIYFKEIDPVWKPTAEWAGEQKGVAVQPGPDNPLGGYWMEMADGIGIHATPFEGSLGESVSHGCIRMSEWGASQVYNAVKVGTPVYILE